MIPRPQIVGDLVRAEPWIGWAIQKWKERRFFRRAVETRVIVEVQPQRIRIITDALSGFQCWPRDGVTQKVTLLSDSGATQRVPVVAYGGWVPPTSIDVHYVYPLREDYFRGTFLVQPQNEEESNAEFHGGFITNCHWSDGVGTYLNWRGNPNRHFPLDPHCGIYLLIESTDDGEAYTAFTPYVYAGGIVIARAPEGALIVGAFYFDDALHIVAHAPNAEQLYRAVGSRIEDGEISDNGWKLLHSRAAGAYPTISCIISTDGSQYVAPDGAKMKVTVEGASLADANLAVSGRRTSAYSSGYWQDCRLSASGGREFWPGLEKVVYVDTSASCQTSSYSSGSASYADVPVKTAGYQADLVRVSFLDASEAAGVYARIYGSEAPTGSLIWAARAEVNGKYCSLTWSTTAYNSCRTPTDYKALGTEVAGVYERGCTETNFTVTATTERGVSGTSDPYGPFTCEGYSAPEIVLFDETQNQYTYTGKLVSDDNPSIHWTATGVTITSDPTQAVIAISNPCTDFTLTVVGACGTATKTFDSTYLAPIVSGPDAPVDGDVYTVTGGKAPYTWSLEGSDGSGGSITSGGVITMTGTCGTRVITVTDSCGRTGTKAVRSTSGRWKGLPTVVWDGPEICQGRSLPDPSPFNKDHYCVGVRGAQRWVLNFCHGTPQTSSPYSAAATHDLCCQCSTPVTVCNCPAEADPSPWFHNMVSVDIYDWECIP